MKKNLIMKTSVKTKGVLLLPVKVLYNFVLLVLILSLVGCGADPYEQGIAFAKRYDSCIEDYNKALAKVVDDFSSESVYQTRTEALNSYMENVMECFYDYQKKWTGIELDESKTIQKFKGNEQVYEFQQGLATRKSAVFCMQPVIKTEELPANVKFEISSIQPKKPTAEQICKDLVGRSIGEGVEDGYYPQHWTYKIGEEAISDFKILSVEEETARSYKITASMLLNSDTRSYKAKMTIRYVLDNIHDWQIEFVQSNGLHIVRTNLYDNCIRHYYENQYFLYLENNCDIALEVGGKRIYDGEWHKFRDLVSPHQKIGIGYTKDYVIDYIERP